MNADYDTLELLSFSPTKIALTNFRLKKDKTVNLSLKRMTFELNAIDIIINSNSKFIRSNILIDDISLNYETPEQSQPAQTPSGPITAPKEADLREYLKNNFGISELDFEFRIGKFEYNFKLPMGTFRIYGRDTSLKITGIDQPINFNLSAQAYSQDGLGPLNKIYVPISMYSQFTIKNGVANLIKTDVSIAGVKNSVTGLVNVKNFDFDANLKTQIPKIENLEFFKQYEQKFPFSNAAGALALDISARGNLTTILDSQVKGALRVSPFSVNANFKNPDISIQGPIRLELSSTFTYAHREPNINSATWSLNMENSEITYKDIFHKGAAVKLASEGTLSYLNDLSIEKFNIWFHTLDISAKGMASLQKTSDVSVTIKPFKLQDFKSFLPNNKGFDISGDVEVDARIKGFISQPKYLSVDVKKIHAKNLKYFLKYKNDLGFVEGPISFNCLGNLLIERAQVIKGSITGHSDLTSLVIWQDKKQIKSNSDLFQMNWSLQADDGRLSIEKLYVNTFLTTFTLKGHPPLTKEDSFDLKFDLDSLRWQRAKPFLPKNEWLDIISDMTNRGSVRVRGKLDPSEILKSKVSVEGDMNSIIATLSLPFNFQLSPNPRSMPTVHEPVLTVPEAFVKDASLLRSVRWNHKLAIQKITFKNSPSQFQNVSMQINLANNSLNLAGQIASLFNGKMTFKDVVIPLVERDPKIQFSLASSNISFSPLVEFVLPDYKDLLTGTTNFEITGISKMPGTLNFKKDLQAKGSFSIPVSELHTMKVIDEVKQKLATIKDIGVPASVSASNLRASTDSEFEIKQSTIQLTNFKAVAPNKDEIDFNGTIRYDLESKISGFLRLASLPVKGDFLAANTNPAGHVEIPLLIEGNLIQPKWSFAGNTLEKMTQKFIDYQKNKAKEIIDRKLADAHQKAQTEMDKQKKQTERMIEQKKKNITDDAAKRLKNLFK